MADTTKKYRISVQGCDDSTTVTMDLTEREFEVIDLVAAKIEAAADYRCMPIMRIEEV